MTDQRLVLRSLGPERKGSVWESPRILRIGRLLDLEVVLTDDSVSRQHAELARTDQGWLVRDLGSTNGSFLNGVPLGRVGQKVRDGDILQCGNVLFAVQHVLGVGSGSIKVLVDDMQIEHTVQQSWEDVLGWMGSLQDTDPLQGGQRLRTLLQVGRDCHHGGSLDTFLESVLWEAAEVLGAAHGCVLLKDATTGQLTIRASFACGNKLDPETWLNNALIPQALTREESLLCRQKVPVEQTIGSLVCALLRSPRKQLGVLCLARTADFPPFEREDLNLADALGLAVSGTIENLEQVLEKERTLFIQTLTTLAQMVEMRKGDTLRPPRRVTDYALLLAEELKLPALDCYHLQVGTPLLDLGKIGLSDFLLQKTGTLSPEEWWRVRSYVVKGASLLELLPGLAPLLPIVRNHHERWDGTGYPDRLAGEQIPLLARIVGLADAFDAMTSERPYARRLSLEEAFEEVQRGAGTQFDPECVRAFFRLRPRIQRLFNQRGQLHDTMCRSELEKTREEMALLGTWRAAQQERRGPAEARS